MNAPQGPLTLREAAGDILESLIGSERGVWFTFCRAWRDPVALGRDYVHARDDAPVRPLRYLIGTVALYSAAVWWLLERGAALLDRPLDAEALRQVGWVLQHSGLIVLLVLPPMAWLLALAGRHGVRVIDALVLMAYVNGNILLAGAFIVVPASIAGQAWLAIVLSALLFVYCWWAMARLLPLPRWRAALLSALVLVAGLLLNDLLVWLGLRYLAPLAG